jgi:hypothetical protein
VARQDRPGDHADVETTSAGRRLRQQRQDEVDRTVAGVGARLGDHDHAGRAALATLRTRLARAHSHCERVEDREWADYRARLDTGLAELTVERSRADGTTADDPTGALFPQLARLELDGWRLRLAALADHPTTAADAPVEPLVAYVDRELETYALPGGASPERRADIHRMLDTVAQRAAEQPA